MILFNIRGVQVGIEFGFVAMLALFSTVNTPLSLAASFYAVFLHEGAHMAAMTCLGVRLHSVTFHALGVRIHTESKLLGYGCELAVMLSGPLANIMAGCACVCLGNSVHAGAQLCIGLMNLLPCTNLDGGCALRCVLAITTDYADTDRLCIVISHLMAMVFLVGGVLLGVRNVAFYFVGIVMLLG